MNKYIALEDTVWNNKLLRKGKEAEGKDLDKEYPKIFRRATAVESLSTDESLKVMTEKEIAKVVEQVKAEALASLEDKIAERVEAKVLQKLAPNTGKKENN